MAPAYDVGSLGASREVSALHKIQIWVAALRGSTRACRSQVIVLPTEEGVGQL